MINICPGTIIWNMTRENIRFFPLKFSLANAYPASVAVSTAAMTRPAIKRSVFRYKIGKSIFRMTVVKLSVSQFLGKITNGFTDVASVIVLNAVSTIQRNGTSIVIETRIRTI